MKKQLQHHNELISTAFQHLRSKATVLPFQHMGKSQPGPCTCNNAYAGVKCSYVGELYSLATTTKYNYQCLDRAPSADSDGRLNSWVGGRAVVTDRTVRDRRARVENCIF